MHLRGIKWYFVFYHTSQMDTLVTRSQAMTRVSTARNEALSSISAFVANYATNAKTHPIEGWELQCNTTMATASAAKLSKLMQDTMLLIVFFRKQAGAMKTDLFDHFQMVEVNC